MSNAPLTDQVAIVTGAAKGIGLEIATQLAKRGATVVISDIDGAAAESAASAIPGAVAIACDVRNESQVVSLIDQTVDRLGRLDVMVPNAGIGVVQPLATTDLATWRRVLEVNLDGVFLCVRYAGDAMKDRGGSIVTISSVTATAGSALIAPYAAAKAAVLNLTKTAAIEWRPLGIRVNAVLPGFIATDLVTDVAADFEVNLGLPAGGFSDLIVAKQGRWGDASDVSRAVAFLADPEQSWITGAGLVLDGGLTASLI
ncbi:SDR family oxidoreductase [Branchiibius sp. NY16-3462-2]|uniref:SDR family NAD(P)-dependent oxidoreductase n=1 Tax=Branchiibius sp. NY16-3462-2 TaxID=1807500 RepID=UPI00079691E0|nr:SDR family oxidoreductase [Branchiibius sp. NY16-3462-2]KYH45651.1 oxidoreductase [Branchiibius sp. NY16-3462-2]